MVTSRRWYFWSLFGAGIVLDQATKYWAQLTGNVTWNPGISFGLDHSLLDLRLVLLLVLVGLVWIWHKVLTPWTVAEAVFLAGASSNLIDRMMFGAVRDWLPVLGTNLHNNLADWLIAAGVVLLLWGMGKRESGKKGATSY